MTNETKNFDCEQTAESKGFSCMEMIAKMMGEMEEGMNCEGIFSQFMDGDEIPEDWIQNMSEMAGFISSCCGSPIGPEEKEAA